MYTRGTGETCDGHETEESAHSPLTLLARARACARSEGARCWLIAASLIRLEDGWPRKHLIKAQQPRDGKLHAAGGGAGRGRVGGRPGCSRWSRLPLPHCVILGEGAAHRCRCHPRCLRSIDSSNKGKGERRGARRRAWARRGASCPAQPGAFQAPIPSHSPPSAAARGAPPPRSAAC